jgi:hypothetical protein
MRYVWRIGGSFVDTEKELLADSDIDLYTSNCDDNTELVLSSDNNIYSGTSILHFWRQYLK